MIEPEPATWCLGLPRTGERPLAPEEEAAVRSWVRRRLARGCGLALALPAAVVVAFVLAAPLLGDPEPPGLVGLSAVAAAFIVQATAYARELRLARLLRTDREQGWVYVGRGVEEQGAREAGDAQPGPEEPPREEVEVLQLPGPCGGRAAAPTPGGSCPGRRDAAGGRLTYATATSFTDASRPRESSRGRASALP